MSEGKEQSRKTGEFPVQQSYSEIPRRKIKMATVKELLRAENDGTLSFGDYTLTSKTKKDNFEFEGDLYKVKTFAEITKLEKESEYEVFIDGESAGKMGTNLSGKLSVSVELNADQTAAIKVVKC